MRYMPGEETTPPLEASTLIDYDGDVRWIGHDIIDRRPLLRLRHKSLNVFAFRIGVDLVGYFDAPEAIADIAVDAEDALDVHIPFNGCRDGVQLNVPVLGNRGNACGQTTCQSHQDVLDRRGTFVLGGKDFRVVSVESKSGFALLFLA